MGMPKDGDMGAWKMHLYVKIVEFLVEAGLDHKNPRHLLSQQAAHLHDLYYQAVEDCDGVISRRAYKNLMYDARDMAKLAASSTLALCK